MKSLMKQILPWIERETESDRGAVGGSDRITDRHNEKVRGTYRNKDVEGKGEEGN